MDAFCQDGIRLPTSHTPFSSFKECFCRNVGSRTGILVLDVVRSRRLLPPILTQVLAR